MPTLLRRLLPLGAIVAASATFAAPASAVTGGQPASRPYPHMAALLSEGEFICGASLVRPGWILTAAHCVVESDGSVSQPRSLSFLIGTQQLSRASDGETIPAAEVIVHERYLAADKPAANSHDVALVRLARRSTKGTPIRIVSPAERRLWAPGNAATVIGWGTQFFPDLAALTVQDQLQEVGVPMVADADCARTYALDDPTNLTTGKFEPTTMVCAGEPTGGKDSCQGDSGGPLMVPDASGALVQTGVVSWGFGCGYPTQYGVYARAGGDELYGWLDARLPGPEPAAPSAGAGGSATGGAASSGPAAKAKKRRSAAKRKRAARARIARTHRRCVKKAKRVPAQTKRRKAVKRCTAKRRAALKKLS
jgi:secreted trypsin-like serine protease